jgi:hypothetical protein
VIWPLFSFLIELRGDSGARTEEEEEEADGLVEEEEADAVAEGEREGEEDWFSASWAEIFFESFIISVMVRVGLYFCLVDRKLAKKV